MKTHVYKTRVRYAEVDQMGVVYYANYLIYLESARTGMLRELGHSYAEMEKKGILLPVTECKINYMGSARYDEKVSIETNIGYVRNASIKFVYLIQDKDGKTIGTAHTIHPFVDPSWKIISVPSEIKKLLSDYIKA